MGELGGRGSKKGGLKARRTPEKLGERLREDSRGQSRDERKKAMIDERDRTVQSALGQRTGKTETHSGGTNVAQK